MTSQEKKDFNMTYNAKMRALSVAAIALMGSVSMASAGNDPQLAASEGQKVLGDITRQDRYNAPDAKPLSSFDGRMIDPAGGRSERVAGAENIRFTLADVVFEGNTAIDAAALKAHFANSIGRTVSLAEMYDIADKITAAYAAKGHEFSYAVIPAQTISGGVIKVQVVEAFINEVLFEGEIKGRMGLLDSMAKEIKAARPLSVAALERYLLLMNDLPGVKAKAVMKKANVPNGIDMVIKLSHQFANAAVDFNNYAAPRLGRYQGAANISLNSVMRLYERTMIRGLMSLDMSSQRMLEGSHVQTLTHKGLKLSLGGNYIWTQPKILASADAKSLTNNENFRADSWSFNVGIDYPFIRSRAMNLAASLRADMRNASSFADKDKNNLVSQDNYRVLTPRISFDIADSAYGITLLNLEGGFGLPFLGASYPYKLDADGKPTDKPDGIDAWEKNSSSKEMRPSTFVFKPTAITLGGELNRIQGIPGLSVFNIVLGVGGQYTFNGPAMAAREFVFGGRHFGRGFDPLFSGDHGFAGKLEFQATFNVVESVMRVGLQPYAFVDGGLVLKEDAKVKAQALALGQPATSAEKEYGFVAGGGVRLMFADNVSIHGEVTKGLKLSDKHPFLVGSDEDTKDQRDQNWRFYFGINGRF